MKRVTVLLLGLAGLVPTVSLATDLSPREIVERVSQTYSGLSSFRFVQQQEGRRPTAPSSETYEPSGPFGDYPARYEIDFAASIPGRIRLVVSSQQGKVRLVSDGRQTWVDFPNLNEYAEADAVPLLEQMWVHPISLISDDLARYRSLAHGAGHAKLRGEETLSLGGQHVRCYVLHVPAPSGSRTLWVDKERFIVLKDEWISPAGSAGVFDPDRTVVPDSGTWTSRLTKADLGPVSDDIFQFVVPSGARYLDLFSAPVGRGQIGEKLVACLLIGSAMERGATTAQYGSVFDAGLQGIGYPQGAGYVLLGSKAHDFTAGSLGGGNVRLDGLRGKIVVLDFWASWCKPCQEELATIQKLHDELASKGVVFLGIDDESLETVKSFVKAQDYTFPMLLDSQQTVHGLYGVRLVPTTVVIDRKGKIAAHYVGAGGEAQLRRALKEAGLDTTKP